MIREPFTRLQIIAKDEEKTQVVDIAAHPEHDLGKRQLELNWKENKCSILIEDVDVDKTIRLKEFADISIEEGVGKLESYNPSGKTQIVHWLPSGTHGSDPAILINANLDKLETYYGRIEKNKLPIGSIIQLERIGYARISSRDENGNLLLIFLHK